MADEMAFVENSFNCLAYTADRPVTMLGLKDIIIVDTGDKILVTNKNQSENLKNTRSIITRDMTSKTKSTIHETRPWGHYSILTERGRLQGQEIGYRTPCQPESAVAPVQVRALGRG